MKALRLTATLTLLLLFPVGSCFSYEPFPYPTPGTPIGGKIRDVNYGFEPSGITYHPPRGTLFVISDNGELAEITVSGVLVNYWDEPGWIDREAVTYCPVNDALYVWNNKDGVKRIEEVDLSDTPNIGFIKTYAISTIVEANNVETMEFVPDNSSSEGGYFYLGAKGGDQKVWVVEIPIVNTGGDIRLVNEFPVNNNWLADLHYDVTRGTLLATFAPVANFIAELTLDGDVIEEYTLAGAGKCQEGICKDADGKFYIAEDNHGNKPRVYGGVLKFDPRDPGNTKIISHKKNPSVTLKFQALPGQKYNIERATKLNPLNWKVVDSLTAFTDNVTWSDPDLTAANSIRFYRFVCVGVTGTSSKSYMTRYKGCGVLSDANHDASSTTGRPGIKYDGNGSETTKLALQFNFDLSWTNPERQDAIPFPDRGKVISVSNIKLYDIRHRETSGSPILDIYRLKKDIQVVDFFELTYGGGAGDPKDHNNVTWNHARGGVDWQAGGAAGAEDRDPTPLVDNYHVVDERPFNFTIPDANSQFLVDILNNGKQLNLLYECDPNSSPSGDWFQASHYRYCYKISFDYKCKEPVPTGVDNALLTLAVKFNSVPGKVYKTEWADSSDPDNWSLLKTVMAHDTTTYITDVGGFYRETEADPSKRNYRVILLNP